MTKITLFEFHLDGSEFTANAPGSGPAGDEDEHEEIAVADTDRSGTSPLLWLAVIGVVVTVAVAAKKLLGSAEELPPVE